MAITELTKPRALLVDDEPGPCETVRMLLSGAYQVHAANSAQSALNVYSDFKPDVVITDLRMPGKDGIELARELRERDSAVAIILFTAHGDVEVAREGMHIGINDFLQKPSSVEEIRTAVAKCVVQTEERRATHETHRRHEKLAAIGTASNEFVHDLPHIVHEAFHLARSGRPGPVLIDFPKNVQQTRAQFTLQPREIARRKKEEPQATEE